MDPLYEAPQSHIVGDAIFLPHYSWKWRNQENFRDQDLQGITLTPAEPDRAGGLWVKLAQVDRFPEEIEELKRGKKVSKQSHLQPLTPGNDSTGHKFLMTPPTLWYDFT